MNNQSHPNGIYIHSDKDRPILEIDPEEIVYAIHVAPRQLDQKESFYKSNKIERPRPTLKRKNWTISVVGTTYGYLIEIAFSDKGEQSYTKERHFPPDIAKEIVIGAKEESKDTAASGTMLDDAERLNYLSSLALAHDLSHALLESQGSQIDTNEPMEEVANLRDKNKHPRRYCADRAESVPKWKYSQIHP